MWSLIPGLIVLFSVMLLILLLFTAFIAVSMFSDNLFCPKVKQPTKKSGRPRKEKTVEELFQKLEESDSLVLTDYQGLTHRQLEDFKKELKKKNASFAITKNTLLKISIEKSKKYADLLKDYTYEKPTAVLFVKGEFIDALKELAKLNKLAGLPKIKIGVIDGQSLGEEEVLKIASLPNRETLLSQLAGMLNSPISGLVFVLNANLAKLVFVLNEISKNKPADAAPAEQPSVEAVPAGEPPQAATDETAQGTPSAPTQEPTDQAEPITEPASETPAEEAKPAEETAAAESISDAESNETNQESNDKKSEGGDSNG